MGWAGHPVLTHPHTSTHIHITHSKIGRFPPEAPAAAFSFSDVFNPVTFETARGCEARVWDFFVRASPTQGFDVQFRDYALGYNLTNRMPLYVKPDAPLALGQVVGAMRSHFEGTPLQFDLDVGAESHSMPYRWRPLTWGASDGHTYINERSAATQQTGFFLAAQLRGSVPDPIKALMWFAVDDTANAVLTPIYGGLARVPPAYGEGDLLAFDPTKAFWAFNLVVRWYCVADGVAVCVVDLIERSLGDQFVTLNSPPSSAQANFAYARYSLIHPEIAELQQQIEEGHAALVQATDEAFVELWAAGQTDKAQALLEETCVETAEALVARWWAFFGELFVKFMDGNVKTRPTDPAQLLPTLEQPGYSLAWRDRIVAETDNRFRVPTETGEGQADAMARDVAAVEGRSSRRLPRPRLKGM